jgi:protease YdgD
MGGPDPAIHGLARVTEFAAIPGRRLAGAAFGVVAAMLALANGGRSGVAATLPGIGAADPRVPADMAAPPWTAVARLQIPGVDRCTAFLIAPARAVTAAHCLWSARLHRFMPPAAIHVLTGYASGAFTGHSIAIGTRIAAGYDPLHPYDTLGADVAVLSLAVPLATAATALTLADGPPAAGAALSLGGFSQDRAEILLVDRACTAGGFARDRQDRPLLRHDCTATHGTSGAPVLTRAAGGGWWVVGVQVAATIGARGGEAVPVLAVRDLLRGSE